MRTDLSLYVHIPFCASKCHYCAFCSMVAGADSYNSYLSALLNEIKIRGKEFSAKYQLKTIYIGGGTPSVLPVGFIKDILSQINKYFLVKNDAEITIEMNPNSITYEKVHEYLTAGINRFSIGLQSANPQILKMIGRTHTVKDYIEAVKTLTSAGATNISSDIIIGLPKETDQDVLDSIKLINSLGVKHISMYLLELTSGTKLEKVVNGGLLSLPKEEESIKTYHKASKFMKELGFIRYELSNFSKPGFESKHNKCYWDRGEYLGVGLSAHSFMKSSRFANTQDLPSYLSYLSDNKIPLEFKDDITEDEAREEVIMLSLRKQEGLDLNQFEKQFGKDLLSEKKEVITNLVKNGFAVITETGMLKLTEKGFMVINKVIEQLAL